MRTVYVFDRSTGNYRHTQTIPDRIYDKAGNCTWNGLNDDMTEAIPPACPDGYHLRWTGSEWELIENPKPIEVTPQTEEERWASLTREQRAEEVRAKRDGLIADIMWRVERYQTQLALGITPTDSEEQYKAVLAYIEALRQVPDQAGFPESVVWPTLQ